jgi:hypothetical protein
MVPAFSSNHGIFAFTYDDRKQQVLLEEVLEK